MLWSRTFRHMLDHDISLHHQSLVPILPWTVFSGNSRSTVIAKETCSSNYLVTQETPRDENQQKLADQHFKCSPSTPQPPCGCCWCSFSNQVIAVITSPKAVLTVCYNRSSSLCGTRRLLGNCFIIVPEESPELGMSKLKVKEYISYLSSFNGADWSGDLEEWDEIRRFHLCTLVISTPSSSLTICGGHVWWMATYNNNWSAHWTCPQSYWGQIVFFCTQLEWSPVPPLAFLIIYSNGDKMYAN